MTNVLIRAIRTYIQTLLGLLLASNVFDVDRIDKLTFWTQAAVAAIPAAIAVVQNALEQASNQNVVPRG